MIKHLKILGIMILALISLQVFASDGPDNKDGEKQNEVVIYPNPVAEGSVSVQSDLEFGLVEIVSIVGRIVYSQELEPTISARLNLGNVPSGIYLMRITFTDNTTITRRVRVN